MVDQIFRNLHSARAQDSSNIEVLDIVRIGCEFGRIVKM